MTDARDFDPQIVAFCCLNCAYAAADLAGGARAGYPAAIKIVALPCTGRVEVLHLLRTLEEGADGVLVAGCLPGRCHYQAGNLHAKQRVDHVSKLLTQIGLEGERVRMINVSAGMGVQFAALVTEMTEKIRELGPSPLRAARPLAPALQQPQERRVPGDASHRDGADR
jgi:coenzyme F420-reducing hydrogenase delta subunit